MCIPYCRVTYYRFSELHETDGLSGERKREHPVYFSHFIIQNYCKPLNKVVNLLLVVCLNALIMWFFSLT